MNDCAQTIARIRRSMPRNADVMALCDRVEELERIAVPKPKVDRKTYQREWMRNKRAEDRRQAEKRAK